MDLTRPIPKIDLFWEPARNTAPKWDTGGMDTPTETTTGQLVGRPFPSVSLPSTAGSDLSRADVASGTFILFIYPRTGRPDQAESPEWSRMPGAKGCTPEACEFRDLAADYAGIGFRIYGLSSQDTHYQREAVDRLHLPYPLLSDPEFELADAVGLPTFDFDGERLYTRSTLVVSNRIITHAFLNITDAATHPRQLLETLRAAN